MAPARPFWKGYLKLSLVSCPIAMFPASSSSERVSFRQINKSTGNRLKEQLVDSVTGDVVESGDKGRGYQIGRDQYLPVEDEELESLRLESTHTIDIEKFVPRSEVGGVSPNYAPIAFRLVFPRSAWGLGRHKLDA
jgi:DNA end-binding protein Ku